MKSKYSKKTLLLKTADALESGKYHQERNAWGQGIFNPEEYQTGFCCLHVMAAIATGTENKPMNMGERMATVDPHDVEYGGDEDRFIKEYCGLTEDQRANLINMNDATGRTFPQIANTLRSYAKKLR
jgi:hypothetical protein